MESGGRVRRKAVFDDVTLDIPGDAIETGVCCLLVYRRDVKPAACGRM